jgi:electron transfer flavoprotein beta subunit
MKIVVFVKQVPDAEKVEVDDDTGTIRREDAERILNPYCEYALDAAVAMKTDGDEIIAVSMGPKAAQESLRKCLELGADRAYLLTDSDFAGSDTWATATVLARFLQTQLPDFDLILTGKQAIDGDTGQVPGELAVLLGLESFYHVTSLHREGSSLIVTQDYVDECLESVLDGRCVLAIARGSNVHRIPSLKDVADAQRKQLLIMGREELGLERDKTGLKGSLTRVKSVSALSHRRKTQRLQGSEDEMAEAILRIGGWA